MSDDRLHHQSLAGPYGAVHDPNPMLFFRGQILSKNMACLELDSESLRLLGPSLEGQEFARFIISIIFGPFPIHI